VNLTYQDEGIEKDEVMRRMGDAVIYTNVGVLGPQVFVLIMRYFTWKELVSKFTGMSKMCRKCILSNIEAICKIRQLTLDLKIGFDYKRMKLYPALKKRINFLKFYVDNKVHLFRLQQLVKEFFTPPKGKEDEPIKIRCIIEIDNIDDEYKYFRQYLKSLRLCQIYKIIIRNSNL